MKKVFILVLVFFIAFLFVGCGDSDPEMVLSDDDEVSDDTAVVEDDDVQDEENVVPDETETDEEVVVDEEPTDPTEPTEPTTPEFDPIGNFNLSFSGQINTTISMQSRGGKGAANFMYNGMPFTFQEINVMNIDIFPLAMVNSGNIIVLWIDSFGLGDISGTSEKQVFGISVSQSAEAGSGTMKEISSYAFYGDITVNIQGGAFNIKCVRAVSDSGNYNITSNDGSSIAFSADGNLFDPSLAGSMIPYPACE